MTGKSEGVPQAGNDDRAGSERPRGSDFTRSERQPLLDEVVQETAVVASARRRLGRGLQPRRYLGSGIVTGGSFLVSALIWIVLTPPSPDHIRLLALCLVVHALAATAEFEIGPGVAVPTTPVLLISAFLLPPPLVPVVALGGQQFASGVIRATRPDEAEEPFAVIGSSWHAFGPALVVHFFPAGSPDVGDWPIVVAALAAQMAFDAGAAALRTCYGMGVPFGHLAGALRFTFLIDLLVAPLGFAAVLAMPGSPLALAFIVPQVLLLVLLQRDRRRHIDRTVVLAEAYGETTERARRDPLTGLRNRLAWEEALARWSTSASPIGVVLADADGLKIANDTFGHEMGDRLLAAIGEELSAVAPVADGVIVARLGGDEFGILLPDGHAASADQLGVRLRAAFRSAVPIDGAVPISASVGVGLAGDGSMLSDAIEEADRGVYDDKRRRNVQRR